MLILFGLRYMSILCSVAVSILCSDAVMSIRCSDALTIRCSDAREALRLPDRYDLIYLLLGNCLQVSYLCEHCVHLTALLGDHHLQHQLNACQVNRWVRRVLEQLSAG